MKKTLLALALVAAAAFGFADDFARGQRVFPVAAPAAITSGACSTNVVAVVPGLKFGPCFIANTSSATSNGSVIVTAYTTNVVAGGWTVIGCVTNVGQNVAAPLNFAGYLDPFARVDLQAVGANAVAGCVMIAK